MRQFQEGATMQVATIVRDLETAMKRHWEVFGIGPWDIWEFNPATVKDSYRSWQTGDTFMLDCLRLERQHPSRTNTAGERLFDL